MRIDPAFTEIVQLHERKWGTTDYPGRPTLDQLLSGYIVVMWLVGRRFILSVHQDAAEVNDLVFGIMTGQVDDPHNRKLGRIFVNQQPIDFRIKVVTAPKVQEQAAAPIDPRIVPLNRQPGVVPLSRQPELTPISDNRNPTVVSVRTQPQVVGVIPSPTPAFTIPDPVPLSREKGKDGSVRYGDVVTTPKQVITTPAPDNRHVYVMPRRESQFGKGLDKRLRDEINKRIK